MPDGCAAPRTALVLSGGGAKGLAHVGVLHALARRGIRPDLIVGTSAGALVGGLLASGYSAAEIDSLTTRVHAERLFRPDALAPRALLHLPPLVLWEQGRRGFAVQNARVREGEANAQLNTLFLRGNLLARGDFDSLPIRFRAVATDLADRSAVVLGAGDLAQAVRASVAIPLVFRPVERDGRVLVDGGLSANVPVAIARGLGAERVIVSRLRDSTRADYDPRSVLDVAGRLVDLLFVQPEAPLGPDDVEIVTDVAGFESLDFTAGKLRRVIARGEQAADARLGARRCEAPAAPTAPLPPLRVTGVRVAASYGPATGIAAQLGLDGGPALDTAVLRRQLGAAGGAERFQSVWLRPSGGAGSVAFEVLAEPAPRRVAGVGVVYDADVGGRLWVGLVDRAALGTGFEVGGGLQLGELRRELFGIVRRPFLLRGRPLAPTATLRAGEEVIRLYFPPVAGGGNLFGTDRQFLTTTRREAIGFAGLERSLGGSLTFAAGMEGRVWGDSGTRWAAGPTARLTLVGGVDDPLLTAEVVWTNAYRRAAAEAAVSLDVGAGVRLRPRVRVGWGEALPLQAQFILGGEDGFPGLRIGERRGDREAMASLAVTRTIRGPVQARLEVAAGRLGEGGPVLARSGWVAGARAGIGVLTPLGLVRAEYGRTDGGLAAFLVRIGRWF
ncbi:MAG: patatin-like phospholipase family protein [Gemmatimonadales bacterium]|nr:patatin-like phospholipase family protein [Gemmatimonadales bacterium]